eukprot:1394360-Amorphochlora_amoeboformis.AAC.1
MNLGRRIAMNTLKPDDCCYTGCLVPKIDGRGGCSIRQRVSATPRIYASIPPTKLRQHTVHKQWTGRIFRTQPPRFEPKIAIQSFPQLYGSTLRSSRAIRVVCNLGSCLAIEFHSTTHRLSHPCTGDQGEPLVKYLLYIGEITQRNRCESDLSGLSQPSQTWGHEQRGLLGRAVFTALYPHSTKMEDSSMLSLNTWDDAILIFGMGASHAKLSELGPSYAVAFTHATLVTLRGIMHYRDFWNAPADKALVYSNEEPWGSAGRAVEFTCRIFLAWLFSDLYHGYDSPSYRVYLVLLHGGWIQTSALWICMVDPWRSIFFTP